MCTVYGQSLIKDATLNAEEESDGEDFAEYLDEDDAEDDSDEDSQGETWDSEVAELPLPAAPSVKEELPEEVCQAVDSSGIQELACSDVSPCGDEGTQDSTLQPLQHAVANPVDPTAQQGQQQAVANPVDPTAQQGQQQAVANPVNPGAQQGQQQAVADPVDPTAQQGQQHTVADPVDPTAQQQQPGVPTSAETEANPTQAAAGGQLQLRATGSLSGRLEEAEASLCIDNCR